MMLYTVAVSRLRWIIRAPTPRVYAASENTANPLISLGIVCCKDINGETQETANVILYHANDKSNLTLPTL